MKNKSVLQAVKFTLFSASAGIIQVASFTLLNEVFRLQYWPAYLIALSLSVLWNFTLNRRYTFKSAANVPIAMLKVAAFYLVFTPLSTWLGALAEGSGINEYIVLAVTMITNFVTEFLFCKFVVYKGQEDTRKPASKARKEEKI
ncbi:MAG: GtrA family protein [Oscillospiraceae bacterium]|nr:GtrA family protein [Oscillospiraceae bacterium]